MIGMHKTEAALKAEIERLANDARTIRRSIEHAHTPADKRTLNRQLAEIQAQMDLRRSQLR